MNLGAPSIVLAMILVPAVAGLLSLLSSPWLTLRRWLGWFAGICQVVLAMGAVSAFDTPPSTGAAAGPVSIAQMAMTIDWMSMVEPPARLAVDGLNLYALLLLAIVTLLALCMDSLDGPARGALRQAGIFAVSAAAAGYLLSRDLVLAAACHGTAALALGWVLHLGADPRPRRPAAQSFLYPALLASGLLWAAATWSRAPGDGVSASIDALVGLAAPAGVVVLLTAFLILHLPLLPLHRWQTRGCGEGAAFSGIFLVGGLWTMLGVVGWLRLGFPLCADALADVGSLLQIWGSGSAIVAVGVAAVQPNLGDRLRWVCVAMAGLVAIGLGSMNLPATTGALLLCAALGLPRATALSFVRWLPADGGGRTLTVWWVVLGLSMVAASGTGGFAGLLPLLAGGAPWSTWLGLLAHTAVVGVLLVPISHLSRARAVPIPWSLHLCLVVTTSVVLLSGWRPALLAKLAIPDVERILVNVPIGTDTAATDGETEAEVAEDEDDGDVEDDAEVLP